METKEMATETDFHHQNTRSKSVSKMLYHGSISFGRFAPESLSWEKWSVFSHNRRQEELEKFNFPGFVAQRKAYFEEYYRRVRTMKALQLQENEASGPDFYHEEVKSQITVVEGGKSGQFQMSENDNSRDNDLGLEGNEEKKQPVTKGASLILSSGYSNSRISLHDKILVSDPAKRIAINSNSQGNVASLRSITEKESKNKKDQAVSSEKMKPSQRNKVAVKAVNISSVLGKSRTHEAKNGNNYNQIYSNRNRVQACSGSTIQRPLITRNVFVSTSDVETSQRKTNSKRIEPKDKLCRQSLESPSKETSSGDLQLKGSDNRATGLRNVFDCKSVAFPQKSCDKERKKGDEKIRVTTRTSKPITTTSLNNHNKNLKLLQKDTISQPTKLSQSQRVKVINKFFRNTISLQAKPALPQRVKARQKVPNWR